MAGTFTIKGLADGNYSIVNTLGQLVESISLNAKNNYTFTVDNIENGVYFIVGQNGNVMVREKLVVVR